MNHFAQSQEEAKKRFERFKSSDPFPEIKPALLNMADISDYVAATGMIFPFDEKDLKPASYNLHFGGTVIYFDENGEKKSFDINRDNTFILKKNSIAFVSLNAFFQFPDYIAGRFNLRINNVYRGLLLGTGPLVDPGFAGHLSFPLHNLTANNYIFKKDESIVWMEFTKLSENETWSISSNIKIEKRNGIVRKGKYIGNPRFERHILWNVSDYIHDAESQRPVRSSIPGEFRNSRKDASRARAEAGRARAESEKARTEAEKARNEAAKAAKAAKWIPVVFLIAIFFSLAAIILQVIDLNEDTRDDVERALKSQEELNNKFMDDNKTYLEKTKRIEELEKRIENLENSK